MESQKQVACVQLILYTTKLLSPFITHLSRGFSSVSRLLTRAQAYSLESDSRDKTCVSRQQSLPSVMSTLFRKPYNVQTPPLAIIFYLIWFFFFKRLQAELVFLLNTCFTNKRDTWETLACASSRAVFQGLLLRLRLSFSFSSTPIIKNSHSKIRWLTTTGRYRCCHCSCCSNPTNTNVSCL